jgi:hypothetical protein
VTEAITREQLVAGYELLFDPLTRAAHRACLELASLKREDRWPTAEMAVDVAELFGVPAAELGAFFGLLCRVHDGKPLWVDAVRGPVQLSSAAPYLTREQAKAFGWTTAALS